MTEGANAGAIRASIDFDAEGLERAVNKAMDRATATIEKKIDGSMDEVQESVESGFRGLGHKIVGFLGIEDISASINHLGRWIVDIGMETEKSLNQFQAVSGATKQQMDEVSKAATELGNDIALPGVSAADAAETMTELAKAGFTVDQSMAAAKGSLQLATAAQIDAGEAASIASEAINAFNLKASDSGKVADLLANAANVSAADMTGMADSLKQVSAVAEAAGLSITDTTGAIALMANNSIQGSDAGTSLKSMLVALQAPSTKAASLMEKYGINVYDSSGHLKDLSGIVGTVSKGLEGLTDQQKQYALATIFGTDAIRAINVLMHEGADGIAEMNENLTKEGAAAKLAAANSKGLVGSLGALQSTAESLAIEFYQKVSPALDEFIRGRLEDLPGFLDEAEHYLGELVRTLSPAADLVHDFVSAAEPGALLAFKAAAAALLGVMEGVNLVLEPLTDLVESNHDAFKAIVSAIVAATLAYKVMGAVVTRTQAAFASDSMLKARVAVLDLRTSMKSATTVANGFRAAGRGVVGAFGGGWGIAIAAAATAVGIFAAAHAKAKAHVEELTDSLNTETGALTKNSQSAIVNALESDGLLEKADALKVSLGTVTDAAKGHTEALDSIARAYVRTALDSDSLSQVEKNLIQNLQDEGKTAIEIFDQVKDHSATRADELLTDGYQLIEGLRDEGSAVADARDSWERKNRAMAQSEPIVQRAGIVHGQLSGQVRKAGDSMESEAKAAEHAKRAIEGLNSEAIKGLNAQIDFEQAADDLRKTIRGLNPEVVKSGKALDIETQSGRDVYRAFIDLANASEGVDGGMRKARAQIFNTIRPMVDSKAEANRLTDQFFDLKGAAESVPHNVHIDAQANTAAAKAQIDDLRVAAERAAGMYRIDMIVNTTHHGTPFVSGAAVHSHAGGGAVYGPGTGTSDDVLARLSNGEHVFTAAEVADAGGQQGIYAIRAALRRGGIPALAELAGGGGALVDNLSVTVGTRDDLPEALDETMFHLRRIGRGGRYN